MTVLRQITACPHPATRTITHHTSHVPLWTLHLCDRHRHLATRLIGARRTTAAATPAPRCGTCHDRQPITRAIETHERLWLTGCGEDAHWPARLHAAAMYSAHLGEPSAAALNEISQVTAHGPDDPDVQTRVLQLLATAEQAALTRITAGCGQGTVEHTPAT
ncbi:hypothetical protein ACFU76_04390 [Streptomyces sp. NPDC057539]|uniref:hypothetical protein n=1 Tax=Streptomyces sp. NPDC057539 TaxID=3346159 RepID=UPI0036B636C8